MALFQALASQRMTQNGLLKLFVAGLLNLGPFLWALAWMTSERWDAGTGWKLPVLKAILDDPKKLNQVSFQHCQ
jgi:hypothetical protein